MGCINLDEEARAKIVKLPIVLRSAVLYLLDCVEKIINGDCNEDVITSTMATLNQNAAGRICKDDVVNYDKAGEILGFGATNRNGLLKLLNKHNIKQMKINNMNCGFLRSEVMALRDKLNEDIRNRELKRLRKKRKSKNKDKF